MHSKKQSCGLSFRRISRVATAAWALAILLVLTGSWMPAAQAQTFTVIHNFTNAGDGGTPLAGLTMDVVGNLYGTTYLGGAHNAGTVFVLRQTVAGWVLTPLHAFGVNRAVGDNDGACPFGKVMLAQDGSLYGTTTAGGDRSCPYYTGCSNTGCGTVFHLTPPPTVPKSAIAPWDETVIHRFTLGSGWYPEGDLTFDQSGNVYGTTQDGGAFDGGTIYQLMRSGSGWTKNVLHRFTGGDGADPTGGLIFDQAGNLYGTTFLGGDPNCPPFGGCGVVFQLSPSGSSWTEQILHAFTGGSDGGFSYDGLILDPSGNLYGTSNMGGSSGCDGYGCGTVFGFTPGGGGGWNFNTLYTFTDGIGSSSGPGEKLVMDTAGNLYGTTYQDGAYFAGSIFKLTPSNGSWTYTSLHDFTGGGDGAFPVSNVTFDANGNLYGTASAGGAYGAGVVWEITP